MSMRRSVLVTVEGLASACAEGGLALLGEAGGEGSGAKPGGAAVSVLLVVDFRVGFGALGELVADDEAAAPALRHAAVGKVVADLAIEADGADAPVGLEGLEVVGPLRNEAAADGGGGVTEGELRVGADAEVDRLLGFGLCGRGGRLRVMRQADAETGAPGGRRGGARRNGS